MNLLNHQQLEQSCVVANNRMNRERVALGSNGYESELGFSPIDWLTEKLTRQPSVAWLDVCCGRGKAIIQVAKQFATNVPEMDVGTCSDSSARIEIVGVDLVDTFDPLPVLSLSAKISLIEASLHDWEPNQRFDLITCVHGLHYIGDKLDVLQRVKNWLHPGGRFCASFDLANLRTIGSEPPIDFEQYLNDAGFQFHSSTHLLSFVAGNPNWQTSHNSNGKLQFSGADDQAGPNYTRQEVVNSYYRRTN